MDAIRPSVNPSSGTPAILVRKASMKIDINKYKLTSSADKTSSAMLLAGKKHTQKIREEKEKTI
jgi:hypothetical protein